MTCNAAREVGDEDIVHTSVSIPALHAMRWWWYHDPDAIRFFNRCMESGHPELLFRETLRELYMQRNHVVGLEILQNAASKGHEAVKYALSMMLLLRRDDKETKKNGIKLFHALDAAGLLTVCEVRDTPSQVTKEGLQNLRQAGLLCGGGPKEVLHQAYVPAARKRVCQKNLAAPRVADWMWVCEPMFTILGVRLPFSPFVMGLLNRCDIAPS
ncbi:uncharacterized protein LOC130939390 [Arachis stenosperma]|uniref:uncharacterized protein LOC130939390 n=1 Tax=Arachis stenosperma TaxID=217475 RepID=UPI0025AD0031|nr:uncharacterized protein LOC130939390 [Arachis stenosperma]